VSLPERDIVLFLGAGFSHDAGLPVMSGFGHASKQDHDGLSRHLDQNSPDFRYAAPMLVEAAEVFVRFQQFCKTAPTLRYSDVENIETVFCIAEAMREADVNQIKLCKTYDIDELITKIQLRLWKVYQQYPPLNKERRHETKPETYDRFFKVLKELGLSGRLAVITTNYDLVFEHLSYKNEMQCHYPLKDPESIKVGGGNTPFVFLKRKNKGTVQGPILCKLHGSVNYFQDTSNSNNLYVANFLGGDKPIGKSGKWKDKPAIFAVDSIWCMRNKYGNGFTPAIIPPTYAKLTQQSWLRTIWNTAFNLLSHAKKIVFIGYSMPDSDGFLKSLMHGAMALRASRNVVPPQIFVIDSSQETHHRYKQLFHEIYKEINPLSLSEATKSIIPEILSKNDC